MKNKLILWISHIFNKMGFVSKSEYQHMLDQYNTLKADHDKLFSKPEPVMDYDIYCLKLNLPEKSSYTAHWNRYWYDCCDAQYTAWYMRNASLEPYILREFLYQFSEFDFGKVEEYMKSVNWRWNNNTRTPNRYELQSSVITLFNECLDTLRDDEIGRTKNTVSSGGFEVTAYYTQVNDIPVVKIKFSFNYFD